MAGAGLYFKVLTSETPRDEGRYGRTATITDGPKQMQGLTARVTAGMGLSIMLFNLLRESRGHTTGHTEAF